MNDTNYTEQMNDLNEQLMRYLSYIGIQLLFLINMLQTYLEINYNNLYNNNVSFHKFIDAIDDNLYSLKKLTAPHYIEPPFSYFKVCYKDTTYKEEYMNMDSILYDTKTADTLNDLVSAYKNIFSTIKPIIKKNELEYLTLLHYRNITDDFIVSKLICNDDADDEYNILCDTIPTRNFFLSIEYQHPKMNNTITLNLDKRYLITGNELFSPCFVLKCLNYQNMPYIFDNNYKLVILDSDINTTTLKSTQYIRLSNLKYEVIDIKSDNKTDIKTD